MVKRVCDVCGRVITDYMLVPIGDRELYTKCNPHTIGITCPKDWDWDLCPSCREKLYSWVQEQKAAAKESFDAEDKEWGTMEERCNNEPLNTIHRIRDKIREVRRKINEQ